MNELQVVILAAGKGTRMRSSVPKVLHKIADKPMLFHVIETATLLSPKEIIVVIGHESERVKHETIQYFSDCEIPINFVEQKEQLGTGHAVMQASSHLNEDAATLVLYGDVPLTNSDTLRKLTAKTQETPLALLTFRLDNPTGYGRILRDGERVKAIVEQKDASEDELRINEVNSGIMAFQNRYLIKWLTQLDNNNAQHEYYLTDVVKMSVESGHDVSTVHPANISEVQGVNSRKQQMELEREYQITLANGFLNDGLSLADSKRFDCRGELKFGLDCFVDINCVFTGQVTLGNNVTIDANCNLSNCHVGDNVHIKANTIIEDSSIASECIIGPFARLRPKTQLHSGAKIGNFVETKNANIGEGSKVNHLSYVGDAEVGKNVNIGAGTITCNYDGANKHITDLRDNVFIGSNSALVAPLTINEGATVGAGSVITSDIDSGKLALTRTKQREIEGWQRPTKKK